LTGVVLLTGAGGRVGGFLRARLPGLGFELRLLDRRPIPGEPLAICADVNDLEALAEAMAGAGAVVHLAGATGPQGFEAVLEANIRGTYCVFEAARLAGVERVVFASSNHANGFAPRHAPWPNDEVDRPDSLYGASKLFGEHLGRFYFDRFGLEVACLRIGTCFERPNHPRALATWLSPGDCARLVATCLRCEKLGYAVVYAISANTRRFWDLRPAEALGYEPLDDAEAFADEVLAEFGGVDPSSPDEPQGGPAVCRATGLAGAERPGVRPGK
jgi:uronate dehydrogenase